MAIYYQTECENGQTILDLDELMDELRNTIESQSYPIEPLTIDLWPILIVEMTPEEFAALPRPDTD